jgi:putative addiction module killer protein
MWVISYEINMDIIRSAFFKKWFSKLNDLRARARIDTRIKRLARGNPGDHRFLGDISEIKIDYGPGYRVYYKDTGKEVIILLCGGDKSTQQEDIDKAREVLKAYEGDY